MGLLQGFKNMRERSFNKKVRRFLDKDVSNTMEFNAIKAKMFNVDNTDHFTKRLIERSVWYSGIEEDIRYFYATEAPRFSRNGISNESLNYFWHNVDNDHKKHHSGIPQLIPQTMKSLLIGNGYNIAFEDATDEQKDQLDKILDDNKFAKLLGEAIETESWSGGVAFKISFNTDISEYPIIQIAQPETYSNVVVAGRVIEDVFTNLYNRGEFTYKFIERYGVEKGSSYIRYELYKTKTNHLHLPVEKDWRKVDLGELPETADFKDIEIKGYNKKLSLYKPNLTPNNEFRGSIMGQSDFAGSEGLFDALDSIISTWMEEFEITKIDKYIPKSYIAKSVNGMTTSPGKFKREHIQVEDPIKEGATAKIEYVQGELRVEKHLQSYNRVLEMILNNAGISPITIGASGFESTIAGAESQKEREKVSIRTRQRKIELWQEFTREFLPVILQADNILKNMFNSTFQDDILVSSTTIEDYEIELIFNDYILKSKKERTEEVTPALGLVWSIEEAIKYVHDDMSEEEQLKMLIDISGENPSVATVDVEEELVEGQ